MIKQLFLMSALMLTTVFGAAAQPAGQDIKSRGAALPRTEFVSYEIRENAEKRERTKERHYLEPELRTEITGGMAKISFDLDVPALWLDREVFVHIEGVPGYKLTVNGKDAGGAYDSRTPAEFNIVGFLTDGDNRIALEPEPGSSLDADPVLKPYVYIYSQPKVRVEDFTITAKPDSTGKYGILDISIALVNSYNFDEAITVGYDIYSPQGKLQYYDMREVRVPGQGADTLRFSEFIYGTPQNLWTPEKPSLYYGMVTVKRGGGMVEYIPYKIGFGVTEINGGTISRNGKKIEIKAARYNAAADRKTTSQEITRLKKDKMNTVWVDYPQPEWFYEVCDEQGMYVIDQPNINSRVPGDNRNVGGTPVNDPRYLGAFMERTETMYERGKNHTSIIGWSLGSVQGNGYNFYKTYLWLKNNESSRAVIYNGAEGEWNTDMEPLSARDAGDILSAAPQAANPRKK